MLRRFVCNLDSSNMEVNYIYNKFFVFLWFSQRYSFGLQKWALCHFFLRFHLIIPNVSWWVMCHKKKSLLSTWYLIKITRLILNCENFCLVLKSNFLILGTSALIAMMRRNTSSVSFHVLLWKFSVGFPAYFHSNCPSVFFIC